MRRSVTFSVLFAVLALAACGIEGEPIPKLPSQPEDPQPQDPQTPGEPGQDRPAAPVLDPTLQTITCAATMGLRGTAAAGLAVFATGGSSAAGISTDSHPSTGSFCLPVALRLGDNRIEVRVQDPVRGLSEAAAITIVRQECGGDDDTQPDPVEEPEPRNIALGLLASAKETPEKGNLGFLTDDKSSTVATFKGSDWPWDNDPPAWVSFELDKLQRLSEVVVRWRDSSSTSGKSYGKIYKILVSAMSDPGAPSVDNGYWTEVADVTAGKGSLERFTVDGAQSVRHVAIWMIQDGAWNMDESFALAEVEIWDAPEKTTTQPTEVKVCGG